MNFMELWIKMVETIMLSDLGVVAMILKNIWHQRNKVLFDNTLYSPKEVYEKSLIQLEVYLEANQAKSSNESTPITSNRREKRKWEKLAKLWMKANYDVAINNNSNSSGLGGIIRDSDGEAQLAFCKYQSKALILEVAEALVVHRRM